MKTNSVETELVADEIASPSSRGGFFRYRPGYLRFSKAGRILEVSKASRSKLGNSKKVLRYRSITPGFVDSHTHLIFAGNRADEWNERLKGVSYEAIKKRGGGIQKTVDATRRASESDLLARGLARIRDFLSYGVTSLEAKSGYGLDLNSELKILKVLRRLKKKTAVNLFSTFMGAHARPREFMTNRHYIEYLISTLLPRVKGLADFQDVFCERGYFSEAETIQILRAGKKLGLIPKVHAHEFGRTRGVRAAAAIGAVSADHLMFVNDADIRLLKKSRIIPVILPGTSFFLGGKNFAPARKMWDAGLRVAIGSDFNPGTNPTRNFLLMGTFAAIFQNLSLDEVLTAQTLHGALALGRADRGCLEVGMRADFVAWDSPSFEEIYYSYGSSRASEVFIGGRRVL